MRSELANHRVSVESPVRNQTPVSHTASRQHRPGDSSGSRSVLVVDQSVGDSARRSGLSRGPLGAIVWIGLFLVLNANGREIGSFDSQPAKLAARELALHGTLTLDRVVQIQPLYAQRAAFVHTPDGHWRNAHSPVPVLEAGATGFVLSRLQLLDLESPAAPSILAKLTASLLISTAGLLCFLTAARVTATFGAILTVIGFVLGTGLWPTASQTLWQHESAVTAVMAAVWLATGPTASQTRRAFAVSVLLAIAGASRAQLAPEIACLMLVMLWRGHGRTRMAATLPLAVGTAIMLAVNYAWFGTTLGTLRMLEQSHPQIHGVTSSIDNVTVGGAGLLISPSRGLLVFSPIVVIALMGLWRRDERSSPAFTAGWCAVAALIQFLFYALYSVWWGGHTYGPRYCLDFLPLLVPLAAHGVARLQAMPRWTHALAVAALCWSVTVGATGAFVYPNDMWNIDPLDVDRRHERLWDWRDSQIARCWTRGLSPQNFELFHVAAWRTGNRTRQR
jgi:hypothetical protein